MYSVPTVYRLRPEHRAPAGPILTYSEPPSITSRERDDLYTRRQKTFHSARIVEDYRAAAQNIGACDGDGRRAVPGAFSGAPRAVVAHGGLWAACCSYWQQRPELQQLAVALGGAPQSRERGRAGRSGASRCGRAG